MNVNISGRHMKVTEGLKDHVESGLEKIHQHFDKVIDVHVILCVEKDRHLAEINLHANGLRINAKETAEDMYASIDSALAKVDRQVLKHKDRINRHKPRTNRETRDYQHHIVEIGPGASGASAEDSDTAIALGHRVIEKEKLALQTMSIDEAALQLDLLEDSFLVFSNAETMQVNVVYGRDDGTYGIIEPQF
ncbi:MAG: ribosomal subunit interface protein [Candidatus Hydrogenedentota bacterium]|nr:MAG: ribosomal subunit interface protein [Candidatus Hydrogenedentota bacterium]